MATTTAISAAMANPRGGRDRRLVGRERSAPDARGRARRVVTDQVDHRLGVQEQLRRIIRGQCRREQVTLAEPAAQRDQSASRWAGRSMPSATTSMPSESAIARIARTMLRSTPSSATPADERLVDLHALDRELLEVGQVRVRPAEVVEREVGAAGPKRSVATVASSPTWLRSVTSSQMSAGITRVRCISARSGRPHRSAATGRRRG